MLGSKIRIHHNGFRIMHQNFLRQFQAQDQVTEARSFLSRPRPVHIRTLLSSTVLFKVIVNCSEDRFGLETFLDDQSRPLDHDQDESQSFGYNGSTAGYLIITLLSLSKLYFYDIREKMLKTGQNLSKIGHFLSRNAQLGCLPNLL